MVGKMLRKANLRRSDSLFIFRRRLFAFVCSILLVAELPGSSVSAGTSDGEWETDAIIPLENKIPKEAEGRQVVNLKYFSLERPVYDLKLSYEYDEERKSRQGEKNDDRIGEFRQGLGILTEGWLYHPAFMDFVIALEPELIQSSGGSEDSDSSYLEAYSLDAAFLPLKPYTVNLFGRRNQNSFRNTFSERAVIDTETYGGRLALKYDTIPASLSYSNTRIERSGALLSSQDQDLVDLSIHHCKKSSITEMNANYRDILQTNEEEVTTAESWNYYLKNTFFPHGTQSWKVLSDIFSSWTDNEDVDGAWSFTASDFRWSEHLYWTHRENLWTDYALLFQEQETNGTTTQTASAGASLQHLLYENLTTSLTGEALRYGYDDGSDYVYSGSLDFDYSRRIPWGTINMALGGDSELTKRNGNGSWVWVLNEQHAVTTGGVIFLERENADGDSIRITDKSGTIVYVRDQDYIIEDVGTRIRVRPTLIGNLSDGRELLIDYRVTADTGYDDLLLGYWGGVNVFLWSRLRLSYDYYRRTQDIISGVAPDNLIDETVHKAQIRFLWKWTDTAFTYEDYETGDGSARSTWLINEQIRFQLARSLTFDLAGYFGSTSFKESHDTEEFYRISTRIGWTPVYWCRTGFEAYQYDISGDVQDASNAGILAFADMYFGRWKCSMSYRVLDHVDELLDYDRERVGGMVQLSRSF